MTHIQTLKEILNASHEYIKLANLELNTEYDITGGQLIESLYGNRVQLILNNKYKLWLPERYVKLLTNEDIQTLVTNKLKLVYNGKKDLHNSKVKHDIIFV